MKMAAKILMPCCPSRPTLNTLDAAQTKAIHKQNVTARDSRRGRQTNVATMTAPATTFLGFSVAQCLSFSQGLSQAVMKSLKALTWPLCPLQITILVRRPTCSQNLLSYMRPPLIGTGRNTCVTLPQIATTVSSIIRSESGLARI